MYSSGVELLIFQTNPTFPFDGPADSVQCESAHQNLSPYLIAVPLCSFRQPDGILGVVITLVQMGQDLIVSSTPLETPCLRPVWL